MKNLFSLSLRVKLVSAFLLVSLVPITAVSFLSSRASSAAIEKQALDSVSSMARLTATTISLWLDQKSKITQTLGHDPYIEETMEMMTRGGGNKARLAADLNRYLREEMMLLHEEATELFIVDLDGTIVSSTYLDRVGLDESSDEYFIKGREGTHVKDIYISDESKVVGFVISTPIMNLKTGEMIGVVGKRYIMSALNSITTERVGLGVSGETYIVNSEGLMITKSMFLGEDAILKQVVNTEPVRLFQRQEKSMAGIYDNYRGVKVVGASAGGTSEIMSGLGWLILAEIDEKEAFAPVASLSKRILIITIPLLIFVALFAYFMSSRITGPIGDSIQILSTAAAEISTVTSQLAATSAETSTSVAETGTTMDELKQTAEVSNQKAKDVSDQAKQVADISSEGAAATEETDRVMVTIKDQMEAIGESIVNLSDQSKSISEIIASVNDLADQSNLLAVNAAIEAAQAGEQGRGFAVVAQEVKSLAEQSKQATSKVKTILDDIQKATGSAVMATEQGSKSVEKGVIQSANAGESIALLAENVKKASEAATQIAASSQQQLVGVDQVASAIENIREASLQQVDGTKQVETAAKDLEQVSGKLKILIDGDNSRS
ncbi:MAG: methyl-accepting chemotaxis protein [bacterium]